MTDLRRRVERQWWNLNRFGFAPRKLPRRLANGSEPRVLCNSVPKAGTHLLERALCLHPRLYRKLVPTVNDRNLSRWRDLPTLLGRMRPGQVLVAHLVAGEDRWAAVADHGVKSIFLVRDPRDIVVSQAFYVARRPQHPFHGVFQATPEGAERLRLVIRGAPGAGMLSLADRLAAFRGWVDHAGLVVRFEDLIGSSGGGAQGTQVDTLRRIFEYLELPMSDDGLRGLAQRVFSDASPTFRRGAVGQWRDHFDDETAELFDALAGDVLASYGYA